MASPETEASQFEEPLQRVSSGPFVFDHDFTRENAGSLEDAYAVQKKPLGEGSFGSAFRATCRCRPPFRRGRSGLEDVHRGSPAMTPENEVPR
ncbi:unnamed protein product [Effrenium voratum]|uniref:Uncharacterized protein n=1 Tax=Effrenium voratum TaxID=2562239 RepID=A0AA36I4J5_9DINO|nr:unnamed protein product [Effrenium voratum]